MMKDEIYIACDGEFDGPCPGLNSMLSIGAVAVDPKLGIGREAVLGTYSANLETIPGATADSNTMKWWSTQPDAWEAHRKDTRPAKVVMPEFAAWLRSLGRPPIFVGYPSGIDFTYFYYYLHAFNGGDNPFVRNAIDVETVVMTLMGCGYLDAGDRAWPDHWFDKSLPHTHVALDDAMELGAMFLRIMNDRRSKVWGEGIGTPNVCMTCMKPSGALLDGPHTYAGNCGRRKMG